MSLESGYDSSYERRVSARRSRADTGCGYRRIQAAIRASADLRATVTVPIPVGMGLARCLQFRRISPGSPPVPAGLVGSGETGLRSRW